jgi:hypothetical protein
MPDKPQIDDETARLPGGVSAASFVFNQMPKLLASAPIVLAILGICYDVGFFTRIGFDLFSLFSLSEHLVFAMQAVPDLLFFVTTLSVVLIVAARSYKPQREGFHLFPIIAGGFLFAVGLAISVRYSAAIWIGAAISYFGVFYVLIWGRSIPIQIGSMAVWMIFFAFALGNFRANPDLAWPLVHPATISLTDGPPISGRVLRSGERGLLIFNSLDETVQFKRWDDIRGIVLEK